MHQPFSSLPEKFFTNLICLYSKKWACFRFFDGSTIFNLYFPNTLSCRSFYMLSTSLISSLFLSFSTPKTQWSSIPWRVNGKKHKRVVDAKNKNQEMPKLQQFKLLYAKMNSQKKTQRSLRNY